MRYKNDQDRTIYRIGRYIDSYIEQKDKTVAHARKYLCQNYRLQDICFVIDEKLGQQSNKKLIFLAFALNRERYLLTFLNHFGSNSSVINEFHLLSRIQDSPLNDAEQGVLAQYIIENWQYDIRFLTILSPFYRKIALDGIMGEIHHEDLKIKHLQAFSYSKTHIESIQDRIREGIDTVPEWRKTWMPFLDLSILDNQAVINKHYSIIEIHSYLRNQSPSYVDSPFEKVKIALKLIHRMELTHEESANLKCYIIDLINANIDVDSDRSIVAFLQDVAQNDKGFAEALLITLYKKTELYTKTVFDALLSIGSEFAYKEMVTKLLASTSKSGRIRIAMQLMQFYPQRADSILDYAKSCGDISLIKSIESKIEKYKNVDIVSEGYASILQSANQSIIIPHEAELNEVLKSLAIEIEADTFLASVGFVFSSGLSLFSSLFDYISGKGGTIEIVAGSLQNINDANINTKIDKRTAIHLNNLLSLYGLKLYTYEAAFYHGKFYYLSGPQKAIVIVGSSNISKTAFFDNYELDVLIPVDNTGDKDNPFIEWYHDFKKQCTPIRELNVDLFAELDWTSELNVYNEHFVKLMHTNEILHRIQQLDDSATKRRMENWMRHNPSLCLSVHNIAALNNYVMFVYRDRGIAAFESFDINNAYYVFNCDDYGQLVERISHMSKEEMQKVSQYKSRGYHIQDQDRLQENVDFYFR